MDSQPRPRRDATRLRKTSGVKYWARLKEARVVFEEHEPIYVNTVAGGDERVLSHIVNADDVIWFFDSVDILSWAISRDTLYVQIYSEEPSYPQSGVLEIWAIPLEEVKEEEEGGG
jgi:hypothetical protein